MTNEARARVLDDLISLRVSPTVARQRLRSFDWDSDTYLVILTRADLLRVLNEYLGQRLSAQTVELWADSVECREDIGFEPGFEDVIRDAVFQLSTPELEGPLTPSAALELTSRLGSNDSA